MIKISIIIPIYNAEKHLDRCLKSVLKATSRLQEAYDSASAVPGQVAEILAVDNVSRDDSAKILARWAKKYPSLVKVLTCKTPGAGAVRNYAVRQTEGEYIWFIDADDEITEDSAVKLVKEADETAADFVMLGMRRIYPDGHTDTVHAFDATRPDFRSRFIRSELGPVQVMIRRKWYLEHDFRFIEGRIHEDMEMMPALILYTDKFSAIDEPFYLYYQNPDSVLHKTKWDAHYFDIFPALEGLFKRFEAAEAVEQYHDELEWFFIWNLLMDSAYYFKKFPEGRKGLKRSRRMLRRYFPRWWRNKFFKNTNLKTKIKIIMNYY
ncbi:glycosyltransferase family 2 protein [Candidatus Saccharibacteria bacterium]|nr:glycosyltransferase family 2 protein [Candidatus Saccharibacteria bacterium]